MTREEAINEIKSWDFLEGKEIEAIHTLIPELRESKDERIRKEIIDFIQWAEDRGMTRHDYHQAKRPAVWIAYLEKQKECVADSSETSANEDESIRKFLVDYFASYKIGNVATKLNGVRIDDILNYLEKQKEQDNEEGDFTIYHPQKNGEGKYKCIPFSFYGSLTSFSNDKDLMDFLNECFYDKEECERWCEIENKPELPECKHKIKKDSVFDYLCESSDDKKQKEQKPAQTSEEKEYIRTLKSLISDFIRDKQPEDVAFYQKMYDWLDGRHIEQKHAEWSEEDEEMLNSCISSIKESKENRYAYKETDGDTSYDHEIAWLKSLRPQPHWEPSEEQEEPEYYQHFDPDC